MYKRVLLAGHPVENVESNQSHHVLRWAIALHQPTPSRPGGFVVPAHSSPDLERHQCVVATVEEFASHRAGVKLVGISDERQQGLELLSLLVGDHWGLWHQLSPLQKLD